MKTKKEVAELPKMTKAERKRENALVLFKGCDSDQTDHGKPLDPNKWYFEPLYHEGEKEVWSSGYDSAEEAGAAMGELYDETEDVE